MPTVLRETHFTDTTSSGPLVQDAGFQSTCSLPLQPFPSASVFLISYKHAALCVMATHPDWRAWLHLNQNSDLIILQESSIPLFVWYPPAFRPAGRISTASKPDGFPGDHKPLLFTDTLRISSSEVFLPVMECSCKYKFTAWGSHSSAGFCSLKETPI